MELTVEHTEQAGTAVILAAGKGTIHFAGKLHAALVEAFDSAREIVLDVSGVTEIDAAFLQLLCAAGKSAAATNRAFQLGGCCSEALAQGFVEAGFTLPPLVAGDDAATQSGHGGDK